MKLGVNLEFARTENLGLPAAMSAARNAGYRWVEPYAYSELNLPINSHLSLRSETPHHHIHTARTDAKRLDALRAELGLRFSAIDAHCTLLMPQVALEYLKGAIDFAAQAACPLVMSDEGPVPEDWMDLDAAFDVMCVSLGAVTAYARSRGVGYAMELHNALTARPEYLAKLLGRFGPDELGVNFDTGNCFLAGNDPVEYLRQVAGRVVHVHVKDIPASQVSLRGTVTGTRVGVAAGDGVIDLRAVVAVLAEAGYSGVLSVECDTLDQAARSLPYLRDLVLAKA